MANDDTREAKMTERAWENATSKVNHGQRSGSLTAAAGQHEGIVRAGGGNGQMI